MIENTENEQFQFELLSWCESRMTKAHKEYVETVEKFNKQLNYVEQTYNLSRDEALRRMRETKERMKEDRVIVD